MEKQRVRRRDAGLFHFSAQLIVILPIVAAACDQLAVDMDVVEDGKADAQGVGGGGGGVGPFVVDDRDRLDLAAHGKRRESLAWAPDRDTNTRPLPPVLHGR